MCEILAVHWSSPRPFADLLGWVKKIEHYGLGSFGWGVAWLEKGRIGRHRFAGRLGDDPALTGLVAVPSTHFLIHFRRPNRLSTVQVADTHPFVDEACRFAFCHNGSFAREPELRPRYASRLLGKADSELGFRVLEDLLKEGRAPVEALSELHALLGGRANIGFLSAARELLVFNAYPENRMWRFRSGDAEVASTALHSADDSLFTLVFPEAVECRSVTGVEAVALGVGL
jgi:glucosamine--fructose-6-phosphate aminotransferase (isomerizing)